MPRIRGNARQDLSGSRPVGAGASLAHALLSTGHVTDELKVPKRRVPVSITLVGGLQARVAFFLADSAPGHPGHELLCDLLEDEAAFLPAADLENGAIAFVSRSSLVVVEAGADAERGPGDDLALPTEFAVELTVVEGQRLRGHVSFVRPPDRARLVDFLNDDRQFLPLHGDDDTVRFVHKRYVCRIDLLER